MTYTQAQLDAFIDRQTYPPNKFQLQVLQDLAFGTGNIAVDALAGSGKTTLLVQCAELLKDMGVAGHDVMFLAFNKSIRDELNRRLPHGFTAINSHSYGNRALGDALGKRTRVDYKKFNTLIESMVLDEVMPLNDFTRSERYKIKRKLDAILSKSMTAMVEPDDTLGMMSVANHHGLMETDVVPDAVLQACINRLPAVLKEAETVARNTGQISFDEMLYLPARLKAIGTRYKYILVDEAQDLNRAQQELVAQSLASVARVVIVGDEKQAIYGFAGADDISFQRMIKTFDAKRLPLNICYRCPETVLDYARAIVPQIEPRPGAPAGVVKTGVDDENLHKMVGAGDMVICRLNAPLVSSYFKLIGNRQKAQIIGKDVAAQLIAVVEKVEKMQMFRTFDRDFIKTLQEYERQMLLKYSQDEYGETKSELLTDTVECLLTCYENFDVHSLDGFKGELEKLFPTSVKDDEQREKQRAQFINLSSVHRAKGLEADRVVILKPEKMPLVFPKQQDWELTQEWNIAYVAITRAKKELIFCGNSPVEPVKVGEDAPALQAPQPEQGLASLVSEMDAKHDPDGEMLGAALLGETPDQPFADDVDVTQETVTPLDVDRQREGHDLEATLPEPPPPPIHRHLLKVARGRTDDGAMHRMIDLARELIQHGLWDGTCEVWFDRPYELHNEVMGFNQRSVHDLMLETYRGMLKVGITSFKLADEAERPCPVCDGVGEVDNGKFVCDECDGSGVIDHDGDVTETHAPEKSAAEVSEHLRKLPAGKRASRRAYALAKEHGIDLRDYPGHTFVSPHSREPMEVDDDEGALTSPSFADDDHTIEAETLEADMDDIDALVSRPPAYLYDIGITVATGALHEETAEQADAVRDALLSMDVTALVAMRDLIDLIIKRQQAAAQDDAA